MQPTRTFSCPWSASFRNVGSTSASQPALPNAVRPMRFRSFIISRVLASTSAPDAVGSLADELTEPGLEHAARGLAGGVAHDRRRSRPAASSIPSSLERPAVQERLAIRRLQQDRVVGDGLIQFLARERPLVVGELLDRPAAERVDPLARAVAAARARSMSSACLRDLDAVQAHLVLPGRARRAAGACGCRSARA